MDNESRGWRLIKTWDFGLLWWGQVTSQIGEGLNKVALLWFVYELTGSAMMIATVGLIQTIPPLLFGPIIGVYLDRLRKKPIMIWVDLIRTVLTLLIPGLYGLGHLSLEGLFVLIFLTSMVSTVFGPALVSTVPLLVRRNELVSANALIQGLEGLDVTLILEPGRVIVGNAGILVTEIQYIKDTGEKTFIIVDSGMNDLIRPALYGSYQEIQPVLSTTSEQIVADVVGPICESGDFFAKDREISRPQRGDLLAVMSAGAYGFTMASNYNSHPKPPEILVDGDQYYVVRARESLEDLIRGETIPPPLL